MTTTKPQTEGQRRVRLDFNPGDFSDVNEVKVMAANLMDFILENGQDPRCTDLALDAIESGAMWAVKSLTADRS